MSIQISHAGSETTGGSIDQLPMATFIPRRYKPGNVGNWSGHLAFANDLITASRPSLIVELGTHWGESFFTFCQSVFEAGLDCTCYAVDHWHGEEHAGFYVEDVFVDVHNYAQSQYPGIAYLLRTTFDEAVHQFADNSIDLLHIDGLHTYEAVAHDFNMWIPKVKPGGIVLFHDVAVRHADFGVWRFWQELQEQYPETFAFHHSWGLGVLRKPASRDTVIQAVPFLDQLFTASGPVQERLRRYYTLYATSLNAMLQRPNPEQTITVQVFALGDSGYSAANCVTGALSSERWQTVSFAVPPGCSTKSLRVDPADRYSVVRINSISVRNVASDEVVWSAATPEQFEGVRIAGTATRLDTDDSTFTLLSYGSDPQIVLPEIDTPGTGPFAVDITLRVDTETTIVNAETARHVRASEAAVGTLGLDKQQLEARNASLISKVEELEAVIAQLNAKAAESEGRRGELAQTHDELRTISQSAAKTRYELALASQRIAELEKQGSALLALKSEAETLRHQLRDCRRTVDDVLTSVSWKITRPARGLMAWLRR